MHRAFTVAMAMSSIAPITTAATEGFNDSPEYVGFGAQACAVQWAKAYSSEQALSA